MWWRSCNKFQDYVGRGNKEMYTDFGDTLQLDFYLSEYYECFKLHKKAARLIEVLIHLKEKLRISYTGEHFHCSNGGMSRGESVVSRLKGRGLLKDVMKNWTLWEFQRHYASLHVAYKRWVTEALNIYIVKNHYCSEYVMKKMNAAMLDSSEYKLNPKPGTKTILFEETYDDIRKLSGNKYFVERKSDRNDGKKICP